MAVAMQVRAATDDDTRFLVRLACEAYRDVVTRQFGSWNEGEQAARFAAKVARLPFELAELADRPIAAVSSSVHADHVFLNELLVLPEFQNRGIGGELLEREIRRALQLGLPLRLHTLRRNRALRLFERHGLVVTARGEVFIDMERAGQARRPDEARNPAG
jgi:GNAT superfamily N-acetyltransferase